LDEKVCAGFIAPRSYPPTGRDRAEEGCEVKMAPKSKGRYWSMKDDRLLIELSKSSLTLEAIADRFDRPPASIAKNAVRLGLLIRRGLKVKGK
jgi:hypothetical protein